MYDTYRLEELMKSAQTDDRPHKTNEETYKDFLAVSDALMDADVPTENRVMYYYVYSWWRHPIKRFRQRRALRCIKRHKEMV